MFSPKTGREQKKKVFTQNSSHIFPKTGEEQQNKIGLHSNLVPFFALSFRLSPKYQVISSSETDAQLAKGGHASILQSWRPKRGAHGPMPPP